ncbi:MAG: HPr family phosphocarrier protein [Xanthomonadales bacterium]|nr:HPr family phosphocarrier protein [Xanthomonadales bacterium]
MIEETLTIENRLGLHARAAAKLVNVASSYSSEITIVRDGRAVNAKSIMGVMMLAAAKGTTIDVRVDGKDEADAFEALRELVADKFGEGE